MAVPPASGLIDRWRADTAVVDAGTVTSWPDSVAGYVLVPPGPASQRPTITTHAPTGVPLVTFDAAAAQYLSLTAAGASTGIPHTTAVVVRGTAGQVFQPGGGPQLIVASSTTWNLFIASTITVSKPSTLHLLVFEQAGGQVRVWLNGSLVSGSPFARANRAYDLSAFDVGRHRTEAGRAFTGAVGEMIVWNRVLTDAERATLGRYAQDRYGFTVADAAPADEVLRAVVISRSTATGRAPATSARRRVQLARTTSSSAVPARTSRSRTSPSTTTGSALARTVARLVRWTPGLAAATTSTSSATTRSRAVAARALAGAQTSTTTTRARSTAGDVVAALRPLGRSLARRDDTSSTAATATSGALAAGVAVVTAAVTATAEVLATATAVRRVRATTRAAGEVAVTTARRRRAARASLAAAATLTRTRRRRAADAAARALAVTAARAVGALVDPFVVRFGAPARLFRFGPPERTYRFGRPATKETHAVRIPASSVEDVDVPAARVSGAAAPGSARVAFLRPGAEPGEPDWLPASVLVDERTRRLAGVRGRYTGNLPAGEYVVWVELADTAGRPGARDATGILTLT